MTGLPLSYDLISRGGGTVAVTKYSTLKQKKTGGRRDARGSKAAPSEENKILGPQIFLAAVLELLGVEGGLSDFDGREGKR